MDRPITQPWWREARWRAAAAGVVAVSSIAAIVVTVLGDPERTLRLPANTVTIATVERGVYHDFIPLRGKVVPRDVIYLDALEGGRVERVLVAPGDYVVQGQPLVELSNTELELEVLDREARLVQSIAQLQQHQSQLEQNHLNNQKALAQIEYNIVRLNRSQQRRNALAGQRVESKEALDSVQDELDYNLKLRPLQEQSNRAQKRLRAQQLPQIEAELVKLQHDVGITRSKLDNLLVKAPAAGRMTAIDLKVGETRNRGQRFGELTPETGNKLSAQIDEFYLPQLNKDQRASVEIEGKEWPLRIDRIYPQVREGTFTVDLVFDRETPDRLLPGQTVQGELTLGADSPGMVIPAGGFLDRTGGDWIFVLEQNGRSARRRQIKIGRRNTDQAEVLQGLRPGERVIVSDYSSLERIERVELQH